MNPVDVETSVPPLLVTQRVLRQAGPDCITAMKTFS